MEQQQKLNVGWLHVAQQVILTILCKNKLPRILNWDITKHFFFHIWQTCDKYSTAMITISCSLHSTCYNIFCLNSPILHFCGRHSHVSGVHIRCWIGHASFLVVWSSLCCYLSMYSVHKSRICVCKPSLTFSEQIYPTCLLAWLVH